MTGAASTNFGARGEIREEHELLVDDAEAMARVFEGMGLRPWFRYEKYRTTYRLPGVAGLLVAGHVGDLLVIGFRDQELRQISRLIREHQQELLGSWHEFFAE